MEMEPRLPDAGVVLQTELEMLHQTYGGWGAVDNPTLAVLAMVGHEAVRVTFQREHPYLAVDATNVLRKHSRHLTNQQAGRTKLA